MVIKSILKGLYNDLKTDLEAIIEILTRIKEEKPILNPIKKERFRKAFLTGWDTYFMQKETWAFFFIILLAFSVGWFCAGKNYQNKCNEHIIDTFYSDEFMKVDGNYVRITTPDGASLPFSPNHTLLFYNSTITKENIPNSGTT